MKTALKEEVMGSNNIIYEVRYTDGWNHKHITFVRSLKDVKILQCNYDDVVFTVISNQKFLDKDENF